VDPYKEDDGLKATERLDSAASIKDRPEIDVGTVEGMLAVVT